MNTLPDPERDLQVWKRALPEDEQEIEEISDREAVSTAATMAVITGVIIVIIGALAAGLIWLIKNRHVVGL